MNGQRRAHNTHKRNERERTPNEEPKGKKRATNAHIHHTHTHRRVPRAVARAQQQQREEKGREGKTIQRLIAQKKRRDHPRLFRPPVTVSAVSLSVSTRTPLDDPTLRISLPSSASSRLSILISGGWPCESGLSPSSTGCSIPAFRNWCRKASAMRAASALEMRLSLYEDSPSGDTLDGAWCAPATAPTPAAPPAAAPAAVSSVGLVGCCPPTSAIIGD